MSHIRSDSLQSNSSTLSTLTSCSSEHSVEIYEEKLKPSVDKLKVGGGAIQELVSKAEHIINDIFAPHPSSTYKHTPKGSAAISVELSGVMLAMLACADECGGESGKRYVACAILACSKEENTVEALQALGTTWLTHLLFIFKTSHGHENQANRIPSEIATPTIEKTATHLLEGVGSRTSSFAADVIRRDGYTCVITGFHDSSHPKPQEDIPTADLIGAHILRRAIGQFNSDYTSKSFKSAATTFDILVNFTRLPVNTLEELHERLDDPENGIALQHDAHVAFDNYNWCMKQTEKENVYDLKIFNRHGILRKPGSNRISFEDHSNDFPAGSTHKRNRPVNLPNPQYIAIHAAIAGILNMSGAGKFFDELLDRYKDNDGKVPGVQSYPELEAVMVEDDMRQSLFDQFQIIEVK